MGFWSVLFILLRSGGWLPANHEGHPGLRTAHPVSKILPFWILFWSESPSSVVSQKDQPRIVFPFRPKPPHFTVKKPISPDVPRFHHNLRGRNRLCDQCKLWGVRNQSNLCRAIWMNWLKIFPFQYLSPKWFTFQTTPFAMKFPQKSFFPLVWFSPIFKLAFCSLPKLPTFLATLVACPGHFLKKMLKKKNSNYFWSMVKNSRRKWQRVHIERKEENLTIFWMKASLREIENTE